MFLVDIKAAPNLIHLLVVLQRLIQMCLRWLFNVVSFELRRRLVQVFKQQYDLTRIDISLFEPTNYLLVVD